MSGPWRRGRGTRGAARPNVNRYGEGRDKGRSASRRRRGRWLRVVAWTAASGLLAAGLVVGYREVQPLLQVWLEIREVAVVGARHVTRREVLDRLALRPGETLLSVELPRLVERLRGHAWVKEVELVRRFPHTLEVHLVERRPAAWARSGTMALLLDADGHVLGTAQGFEDPNLPIISGLEPNALLQGLSGARAAAARAVQLAGVLQARPPEGVESVVEVDAASIENLVALMPGLRVQFGAGGFEEKWQRYQRLETELHARAADEVRPSPAGRREIDLRYQDKVIVRERG